MRRLLIYVLIIAGLVLALTVWAIRFIATGPPPDPVLDDILYRYIELDMTASEIVEAGLDEATVREIARLVDRNEYKRRQAPPGVRVSERAFGRDWRYPITSGFDAE